MRKFYLVAPGAEALDEELCAECGQNDQYGEDDTNDGNRCRCTCAVVHQIPLRASDPEDVRLPQREMVLLHKDPRNEHRRSKADESGTDSRCPEPKEQREWQDDEEEPVPHLQRCLRYLWHHLLTCRSCVPIS